MSIQMLFNASVSDLTEFQRLMWQNGLRSKYESINSNRAKLPTCIIHKQVLNTNGSSDLTTNKVWPEYEVEKILRVRKRECMEEEEYLLKWVQEKPKPGFRFMYYKNSWQPKSDLVNCEEILAEFEERKRRKDERRSKLQQRSSLRLAIINSCFMSGEQMGSQNLKSKKVQDVCAKKKQEGGTSPPVRVGDCVSETNPDFSLSLQVDQLQVVEPNLVQEGENNPGLSTKHKVQEVINVIESPPSGLCEDSRDLGSSSEPNEIVLTLASGQISNLSPDSPSVIPIEKEKKVKKSRLKCKVCKQVFENPSKTRAHWKKTHYIALTVVQVPKINLVQEGLNTLCLSTKIVQKVKEVIPTRLSESFNSRGIDTSPEPGETILEPGNSESSSLNKMSAPDKIPIVKEGKKKKVNKSKLKCKHCKQVFKSRGLTVKHLKKVHPKK